MPTVDCAEHGVFAYKTAACPGCAAKAAAMRRQLAQHARTYWEREIARLLAEIAEKGRQFERQLSEAESRLASYKRGAPEAPTGVGAIFKKAAYQRERDEFLSRRRGLVAQVREIQARAEKHDAWVTTFDVAAHVAKTMLETMPEAFELFVAEEKQIRAERAQAVQENAVVAAALAALDERFAVEQVMGSVNTEYSHLLLGAVDIEGKRYARLQRSATRVVCVPWIDAFAERVGEKISVRYDDESESRTYRVGDADGNIDDDDDDDVSEDAVSRVRI